MPSSCKNFWVPVLIPPELEGCSHPLCGVSDFRAVCLRQHGRPPHGRACVTCELNQLSNNVIADLPDLCRQLRPVRRGSELVVSVRDKLDGALKSFHVPSHEVEVGVQSEAAIPRLAYRSSP